MTKKERIIVLCVGAVLMALFTFTDLQISTALFTKSLYGRVFEIVGELPFVFLSLLGCCLLFRFRSRKNLALNLLTAVLCCLPIAMFTFMGGFMIVNYLNENLGGVVPSFVSFLLGGALLLAAAFAARAIPKENAHKAVTYAIIALVYMVAVVVVMNTLKTCWGRMRMREMTDPLTQFTRWYVITPRGGFDNVYASFPSGHSMNSAAVILLSLLPAFVPALYGKQTLTKVIAYVWIALVGTSRIVMGAHFASDVTAGVLLSLLLFEVIRALICRLRKEDLCAAST